MLKKLEGLTVYDWLEMSEEDFEKIRGKGKCVKCEKLTTVYENLCHGHKIAYHRWRNKMEKCPKCESPDTREQLNSSRKCARCLHVYDPHGLVLSDKEGEKKE